MLLRGTITRVRFYDAASGFAVIAVRTAEGQTHSCVGRMFTPLEGMEVRADAIAVRDPKYGPQLRLRHPQLQQPTVRDHLVRYLTSGVFAGVGRALSERLLDAFGEKVFEVLETRPDLLTRVRGITPDKAAQLHAAFLAARPVHDVMFLLQRLGIGPQLARRVCESLGRKYPDVAAAVRYNPYVLSDVTGIGFVRADEAARRLGLARDAPPRILAGIVHVMRLRAEQGHSEARRGVVAQAAARLLGTRDCTEYVDELVRAGTLVAHRMMGGEAVVALPELSAAERTIATNLVVLNSGPPVISGALDVDALVERAGMHIPPSQDQRDAIAQVLRHPVAILTGGPGTGKTTITRLYLQAIEEAGLISALCAPTARAAVQLTAATGRSATTIHRLLGLIGTDEKAIARRKLEVDALVCDEASMVGGGLAARLVRALQGGSRLLLVGDPDQLESIEWGNLLIDLIASGVIPVARLTELHRTGEGSGIARAAREVLSGHMPSTAQDFTFVEIDRPEDVADYIVQETLARVRSTGSPDSVQVLTPLRQRGPLSSDALNRSIQFQLFGGRPGLQVGPHVLHVGDKVVQTRNNYRLGIVNGDVGKVVYVSQRHRAIVVDFHGGRRVTLARDALYAVDPAYSMSVHKSQGGQFQEVIMPVHSSHAVMLTRSVLYTGMTRAASRLKLAGDLRGLEQAIQNDRKARRETGLARYMREFLVARAAVRPRIVSLASGL